MIDITIDATALLRDIQQAIPATQLAAQAAAYAGGNAIAEDARATTLWKDKTGTLRQSIGVRPVGVGAVNVTAKTDYASYLEEGTPAHVIAGKNGGLLRFQVNGAWVSKHSVNHPGTKPRPFMALAALKGAEAAETALGFRMAGALASISR